MRDIFPEHYKLSAGELKGVWDTCLFVIDANVLLSLYRYPEATQADLLNALGKVQDRLWLPFQAAMEFQRNRVSVVADQKAKFQTVKEAVQKAVSDLGTSFDKLKLKGRHARINLGELQTKIEGLVGEFQIQLTELDKEQPDIHELDKVREKIDLLFDGRVGTAPDQAWVDNKSKAGKERYKYETPPGFKDQTKSDYSFLGVRYEGKYGDLFLWCQALEKAVTLGGRPLVLVTDDQKEDWWERVSGKTIGPHPELIAEMKREGGATGFHMYTTAQFLALAKQFSNAAVDETSISDVEELNIGGSGAPLVPPAGSYIERLLLTVDFDNSIGPRERERSWRFVIDTATPFFIRPKFFYNESQGRGHVFGANDTSILLVRWVADRINESTPGLAVAVDPELGWATPKGTEPPTHALDAFD